MYLPKSYAADLMLDNLCSHCNTLYVLLRVMLYRTVFYYDVRIKRCHTNVLYFILPQFCPVFTYHKTYAPLLCSYQRQRKSMLSYYILLIPSANAIIKFMCAFTCFYSKGGFLWYKQNKKQHLSMKIKWEPCRFQNCLSQCHYR